MYGDGRVYRRGTWHWIAYYADGREIREGRWKDPKKAARELRQRLAEIRTGSWIPPAARKVSVKALVDALIVHLETKGARSVAQYRAHAAHIQIRFGHLRAVSLTRQAIEAFQRDQLEAGYAPASVNRQCEVLRQAIRLAARDGQVIRIPYVPRLTEDNTRSGFLEPAAFERLAKQLPAPIDDITRFAYATGWRKSEILGLRWEWADLRRKELRIPTSKSGEPRIVPLTPDLQRILRRAWAFRSQITPLRKRSDSEWIWHRAGRPIVDLKRSWRTATKKAGCPGLLFHDMRRSAARNMRLAGVPRETAKRILGHRTDSMFDRYQIIGKDELRAAMTRTENAVRVLSVSSTQRRAQRRTHKAG